MSTTTISVRVSHEAGERLAHLAQATQRSKFFLAAEAIEEYLAVQEWQVAVVQKVYRAHGSWSSAVPHT